MGGTGLGRETHSSTKSSSTRHFKFLSLRPLKASIQVSKLASLLLLKHTQMALEWVMLGYAAGAEAVMLLLLTLPGLAPLRKGLTSVTRSLLRPLSSIVPFCIFLVLDIYWKFETRPSCESPDSCTPSEHLRYQKSMIKSQRNALLIAAALLFYWLLYSVSGLVVRLDQLNYQVEKLKKDSD